jgi:hypothetical protein
MEPGMEKSDLCITNMTQATGAGKEKHQPASPIHSFVFLHLRGLSSESYG